MFGKCTRNVPGSSFQWETVSESSTKISWDDGNAEDLITLNVPSLIPTSPSCIHTLEADPVTPERRALVLFNTYICVFCPITLPHPADWMLLFQ